MTDWKNRIDLADLHDKYEAGTITPPELGKQVASRLRKLLKTARLSDDLKQEAEEIADEFEMGVEDVDDYDNVLERLYDWGDTELPHPSWIPFPAIPKVCWIDTFGVPNKAKEAH